MPPASGNGSAAKEENPINRDMSREFFSQNQAQIKDLNASSLRSMTFLFWGVTGMLSVLSFIPAAVRISPVMPTSYRFLFLAFFAFYTCCMFFLAIFRKLVRLHPLPGIYVEFVFFYIFLIAIQMLHPVPLPYIFIVAFRVMIPVLVLDRWWKQFIVHNSIMIVALVLSYFTKPEEYFLIDIITAGLVAIVSFLNGHSMLNRQMYSFSMEQKLDRDLELAKAKSDAKTMFLANMSHEIRTPINAVLGFDEMILRECSDRKILEYATSIRSSGRTLLALINDILNFSKIEAGKIDIVPEEYELSSTICDLVNMVSEKARAKRLQLNVYVNEKMPHLLFGDEVRIKQCMLNILNNAVKYTERGSVTLNIGFEKIDSSSIYLKVEVKDTGIGIKAEDLPRLFKAFERVDEKRNRTIEGTGLGLNIVAMLLDKMESHLEVSSECGKGSDFSFAVRQRVVWWEEIGNFNESYRKYLQNNKAYAETFRAPNAHILVVDDTQMNLTVVEGLLRRSQIHVDTALSGREALELVQHKRYDVIFLDHRMPEMDGVETFHEMQKLPNNMSASAPCIMFTANAVSGAREAFLAEGFANYLTKPVDSLELEKMLVRYLPKDLVIIVRGDGSAEEEKKQHDLEEFQGIEGLDAALALQNCGSPETLREALREYRDNIEQKASLLEQYLADGALEEYTVLVHSIKSSSRLIGAEDLSRQAAYLEQCGDEKKLSELEEKTPVLLELYRSYIDKLSLFAETSGDSADQKPLIDETQFKSAMDAIKEYASAFDFNSVDKIIEMLDKYTIPEKERKKYADVKRKTRAGDSGALVHLLEM